MPPKNSRLLFWTTCLGNTFEHYDAALYALLSPFIASLFFPFHDPLSALILTYTILPVGMAARPFGSLFFGYIGDTYGRKKALLASLIGMSITSAFMALMPTYNQIGTLAPILLALLKILQNFFASGETIGGAVYLIENSTEKKRNLMSGLYSSSTIGGILLASIGVSILSSYGLIENWWRILYVIGCSTASFGWILRIYFVSDSFPVEQRRSLKTILNEIWNMRGTALTIAIVAGFSYSTYIVSLVMLNGLIPLISDITKSQIMHINTFLLVLDLLALPLFGYLGNIWTKEKLMITASTIAVLAAIPLFILLEEATLSIILFVRICIVLIGVCFSATFYSWAQELVPKSIRYTIVGFSYACGSQLLGGPTAAISLWVYQQTNIISSACWYWMFLALISTFIISKKYSLAKNETSLSRRTIEA